MKFAIVDERPQAPRAGRAPGELSEEEQAVLNAFRDLSIKNGAEEKGVWLGAPVRVPVKDIDEFKNLRKWVQKAATITEKGARVRLTEDGGKLAVTFWAVELPERTYVECPVCGKNVVLTEESTLRTHGPTDNRCDGSGKVVRVVQS